MNPPVRSELKVVANIPFGQSFARSDRRHGFCALTLENPGWSDWMPGQYVMIRPASSFGGGGILSRPLSICRVTTQGLVLFFRADGPNACLARLKIGDGVVLWGPLGRGFAVEPGKKTLLMSYGEGIAPFFGYVDRHPDPAKLFLLFGHPLPSDNYPADAMSSRVAMEDMLDDGKELRSLFYETVSDCMERCHGEGGLSLACGPMFFLKKIWRIAQESGASVQLSLEKRIVCGTGACMGCATQRNALEQDGCAGGEPLKACVDGPVFWAADINLDGDDWEDDA